jgi:hypothetical protein
VLKNLLLLGEGRIKRQTARPLHQERQIRIIEPCRVRRKRDGAEPPDSPSTASTVKALLAAIKCRAEPVGEFKLKGIRRPLAAYNVVAATSVEA